MDTTRKSSRLDAFIGIFAAIGTLLITNPTIFSIPENYKYLVISFGIAIILSCIYYMIKTGYFSKENQKTVEFKGGILQATSVYVIYLLNVFPISQILKTIIVVLCVILFVYSSYLFWSQD